MVTPNEEYDDGFDGFIPIEDDLMYPYDAWQDYMGFGEYYNE